MYTYVVIDDENIIRKGIIKKISDIPGSEYKCVGEASNGRNGLEIIENYNPDFIITDMKMSKMDGVEFLENLRESGLNQPVIVISSFKDFEYMHKAIESRVIGYVLKPFTTEEIAQQLVKVKKEIEKKRKRQYDEKRMIRIDQEKKTKSIQQSILGIQESFSEWEEEKLNKFRYMLLLTVNSKNQDMYDMLYSICEKMTGSIKYMVINNSISKYQSFILFYTEEDKSSYLNLKARTTAEEIEQYFAEEKIFIVVSRVTQDYRELNSLKKENDRNLRKLYIGEFSQIMIFSGKKMIFDYIYSPESMADRVRRMKYNTLDCAGIMDSFFSNIDIRKYSLGDIRKTCGYIVKSINEYAVSEGVETDDIMRFFDTRYIFEDDIQKMKKEISGYICLIMTSISGKEKQRSVYDEIKEYIDKNYNRRITLQLLADDLGLNPSVIRNTMKEKRMNFHEYLTGTRMMHAKRMLLETNLSIEVISKEIGYINPKYFFKVFKKEIGVTPQEYRKRKDD